MMFELVDAELSITSCMCREPGPRGFSLGHFG